jgi:hypothetical protein
VLLNEVIELVDLSLNSYYNLANKILTIKIYTLNLISFYIYIIATIN